MLSPKLYVALSENGVNIIRSKLPTIFHYACLEFLRWKTTIANNHCLVKLSILKYLNIRGPKTLVLGGKDNFYNSHLNKRKTCLDYHNIAVIHLTYK